MKKIIVFLILCIILISSLYAQNSFVIWDKSAASPISMASIYTTSNGTVKSVFSDESGCVSINFKYDSLTVSHINYQKICLKTLPDTLFMEQSVNLLHEVVVTPVAEPEWIRPMLLEFVKTKKKKYRNDLTLNYSYTTQNVGDSSLYIFSSQGLLRKNKLFEIFPVQSTITFHDKTAGCDYSNLKNTLYHDFVSDMDKKFVNEHKYFVDYETDDLDENVVRIFFSTRKDSEDTGYICIDTVQNVIVRVKRATGLSYNVKNRTNTLMRSVFNKAYGHEYKNWQIEVDCEYQSSGSSWYLSRCNYANFINEEFDFKKKRGNSIYNMTSTFTSTPCSDTVHDLVFLEIPEPFTMKIIMSGKEKKQEEKLQNVNREYITY